MCEVRNATGFGLKFHYRDFGRGNDSQCLPSASIGDGSDEEHADCNLLPRRTSLRRVVPTTSRRDIHYHKHGKAGASKADFAFAEKHAKGIYCGVPTIEGLAKCSKLVREAAVAASRDPSSIKLFSGFSGICPILGRTEQEAQAKRDRYLANTSYIGGLSLFCALTGVDLSKYGLDEPFDFDNEDLARAVIQGIFNNFKMVERANLGLRVWLGELQTLDDVDGESSKIRIMPNYAIWNP